jgi:hypothetical protein
MARTAHHYIPENDHDLRNVYQKYAKAAGALAFGVLVAGTLYIGLIYLVAMR